MNDPMDFLHSERVEPEPLQEDLDIETVMKTKAGRATMVHIMDIFGTWTDTYASNPHDHARNAGLRGAGIVLENKLKYVCPLSYQQMMKEKFNE